MENEAAVLRWWIAVDAPADSDERQLRLKEPDGVFRTQEDALQPGWHAWETNFNASQRGWPPGADWQAGLSCETTRSDQPGAAVCSAVISHSVL